MRCGITMFLTDLLYMIFVQPFHIIWQGIFYLLGGQTAEENTLLKGYIMLDFLSSIIKHIFWFGMIFLGGVFFFDRWAEKKGGFRLIPITKPSREYGVVLGTLNYSEKTIKDLAAAFDEAKKTHSTLTWGAACIESGKVPKIHYASSDLLMENMVKENAERLHTSHSYILIFRGMWPVEVIQMIEKIPTIISIKGASNEIGSAIVLRVRRLSLVRFLFKKKNPQDHIVSLIGYQDGEQFDHLGY